MGRCVEKIRVGADSFAGIGLHPTDTEQVPGDEALIQHYPPAGSLIILRGGAAERPTDRRDGDDAVGSREVLDSWTWILNRRPEGASQTAAAAAGFGPVINDAAGVRRGAAARAEESGTVSLVSARLKWRAAYRCRARAPTAARTALRLWCRLERVLAAELNGGQRQREGNRQQNLLKSFSPSLNSPLVETTEASSSFKRVDLHIIKSQPSGIDFASTSQCSSRFLSHPP